MCKGIFYVKCPLYTTWSLCLYVGRNLTSGCVCNSIIMFQSETGTVLNLIIACCVTDKGTSFCHPETWNMNYLLTSVNEIVCFGWNKSWNLFYIALTTLTFRRTLLSTCKNWNGVWLLKLFSYSDILDMLDDCCLMLLKVMMIFITVKCQLQCVLICVKTQCGTKGDSGCYYRNF